MDAVVARRTFPSQNVQNTRFGPLLEMSKKWTPLWREEHFQVKMYKIPGSDRFWRCRKSGRRCGAKHNFQIKMCKISGSDHFWRCRKSGRRCGAKNISKSKCTKHQVRTTFGDVEKVDAVVARRTFPSQNIQTPGSDHFWRCRKSGRRCGAKNISKLKCTKHHVRTTFGDVEKLDAVVARRTFPSQNVQNTRFGPLLEMSKKWTPLWREEHFQVKIYKTPGSDHFWRCRKSGRRCGAKNISKLKCTKHQVRTTFGDVEKVDAVVARRTFPSQNVQNTRFGPLLEMSKKWTPLWREEHFQVKIYKTPGSDHFWRCRKSGRRCGAKNISKSKCTKHQVRTTFGDVEKVDAVVARRTFPSQNVQNTRFGPLLEMSKKSTPLWREEPFQVKMYKTPGSDHFWRCRKSGRRCGAKNISKSKCTKHQVRTTFGDVEKVDAVVARRTFPSPKCTKHQVRTAFGDVEKVDAVVARRTFPSQNVQNTRFGPLLEMSKKWTPLWREEHFQVKMYKTPASDHFWRCRKSGRRCGAKNISKSKCTKHQVRTPFGDVEKVDAVVARRTFPSQNVQNTRFGPLLEMSKKWTPLWREKKFQVKIYKTPGSDQFWRCRKSGRRCGVKNISKSKCTKHQVRTTFGDVEKVDAVVARRTFPSQNVQNTRFGPLLEMSKKWTPLWREEHFQVKMYKTPGSDHFWRCRKSGRRCGAKNISKSKCTKHQVRTTFGDVEKVDAVVARRTFPSQNIQNTRFGPLLEMSKKWTPLWREEHFQVKMYKTPGSDHLWRCRKSGRRCGAKNISKSKCTKHQIRTTFGDVEKVDAVVARRTFPSRNVQNTRFGPLLEMSKKWTPLWREEHFQVKMYKTPGSDHFWRCRKSGRRCGAKNISKSKYTKHQVRTTFGDVEKVDAVVARRTFPSQNVQNTRFGPLLEMSKKWTPLWREEHFQVKMYKTPGSDHFWRYRKSGRRCGAKNISKSKCTKHQVRTTFGDVEKVDAVVARRTFPSQNIQNTRFGPLLEMSKKWTPLWREEHFQVKIYKTPGSDHFWRCRKSGHRCGAKNISKSK